jgi:nucleoside-diphosphate-sugar epimerase
MLKILVTGASGFLGRSILACSNFSDLEISGTMRSTGNKVQFSKIKIYKIMDINSSTVWKEAVNGKQVVIHTAAMAHNNSLAYNESALKEVNINGTVNLAKQAAEAGVQRFIFISSIGVNGSVNVTPFSYKDKPNPTSAYAITKYRAEQELWKIQKDTGMEIVIIRPPLIYGPHAPGNFDRLIRLIDRNIPMPFKRVKNKRSFIALDNAVDFILHCASHPKAKNKIFLISDNQDVSTLEFVTKIANAFNRNPLQFSIPISLMKIIANLVKKGDVANSLLESLLIDSTSSYSLLEWNPVITMEDQLKKIENEYYKN